MARISYSLSILTFGAISILLYFKLEFFNSCFTELPSILLKSSHENLLGSISLPLAVVLSFFPDALKNSQLGILKALGI